MFNKKELILMLKIMVFYDFDKFELNKFNVCDTRNITISFLYSVVGEIVIVGKVYLDIGQKKDLQHVGLAPNLGNMKSIRPNTL